MNKRKVIYLCCPYSHDDASVREARFRIACRVAMKLMEVGINGWPDSVGVTYERKRAKRAGKPERFLTRAYLTETCGLTREEINVGK